MKLLVAAVVLLLTSCASSQSASSGQLGTIKSASVACPSGGIDGGVCYALDISCPGIPDYTAYIKDIVPANRVGTVIFTTGGDENHLYEQFSYGGTTVHNVLDAGLEAVELTFGKPFSDAPGWEYDVDGKGVRAAACRYATVVQWVYNRAPGLALCATGNSAGGQMIGEGLAHYGLGDYLVFAEMTSGPPFNRVDYACINNVPAAVEYCSGSKVGMGVGVGDAVSFIDPAYPGPWCSTSMETHSTEYEAQFLNDSVTSPDAVLSYPNTTIRFLFGGEDSTSAIRQGLDYQSKIQQPTTYSCVKDAPHTIPNVLDGAEAIAADLIANCNVDRRR